VNACLQQVLDGDFCRHGAPFVTELAPPAGRGTRSSIGQGPRRFPAG
jgi:hypothetical protein